MPIITKSCAATVDGRPCKNPKHPLGTYCRMHGKLNESKKTDVVKVDALTRIPEGEQRPDPLPTSTSTTVDVPSAEPTSTARTSVLAGLLAKTKTTTAQTLSRPHVIVRARAGTGKTTTIVEGLKAMLGLSTSITPSDQQRAVWDAMLLSRDRCRFVTFVAFNKSIATELQQRVPPQVEAKTMHSLGFSAVRRAFQGVDVDEDKVAKIIASIIDPTLPWTTVRNDHAIVFSTATQLVSLCKGNLLEGTHQDLLGLCVEHDIDFGTRDDEIDANRKADDRQEIVFSVVPEILRRCRTVSETRTIDIDDMVWLPVVLGLRVWRANLIVVDEAQDLNPCQHALVMMAGERVIAVGDDRQAIYAFAGADSNSLDNLMSKLAAGNPANVVEIPLTVTRRCGKAIVDEARHYVSDFQAHELNPVGEVRCEKYPTQNGKKVPTEQTYLPLVGEGDMVVCRSNAPLVSQYFALLKQGKKASIMGRKDVGQKIAGLITRMKDAQTIPQLIEQVGDWKDRRIAKEMAKPTPSEAKITNVTDLHDCVVAFCEYDDVHSIPDVLRKIDTVFSDQSRPGVRLSSIHKAKGLESRNVFFLAPGGFTKRRSRQSDESWQQELNLRYVGITRAIERLVYVF